MIKACDRIIEYSFYALFLLTPLAFTSKTSELFELNKMWLVWALTIVIVSAWTIKIILQKRILLCRTPLDIPIALFLFSQIISTIFSLDPHVSLWGYYSRFNGGLLSIVSYILLYYAFLSNLSDLRYLRRLLLLSLISGLIVALWGLPSHFGYDPTCLLFRGTLDVSCWTADFMPRVRIFSTLGQPNWLAAYLAILIPIAIAFGFQKTQNTQSIRNSDNQTVRQSESLAIRVFRVFRNKQIVYILLVTLFYVDLLYARARSGFLGMWISLIFFAALYYWAERKKISPSFILHPLSFIIGIFLLVTFVIGTSISQLNKFTLEGIGGLFQKVQTFKTQPAQISAPSQPPDLGGTESANIRVNVWSGAINIWKANPLFGTGVETFAFAYYKYKPIGQNLTSEWDYLYNKAHNEYLNYLATTGIFGLGTYLLMIGFFLTTVMLNSFQHLNNKKNEILKQVQDDKNRILTLALLASYISILVTNFFGFSVVITNVYLFMIPAFVFVLTGTLPKNESGIPTSLKFRRASKNYESSNLYQWTAIFSIFVTGCWLLVTLFRFWQADIAYALGYNLDRAGEYQQAYPHLHKAVMLRGNEPVFKDELSVNNAIIAAGLVSQKPSAAGIASGDARQDSAASEQTISVASSLVQEAINTSNAVVSQYQNNAVFWKNRTRLFFALSQVDSRYLPRALDAIEKASLLAPNDARIWYNLGVLYGQNNNLAKGIEALEKTIWLKPDYRDAHFGLGLFYHAASLDKTGKIVIDENFNRKAIAQMQYILDHISPKDTEALKSIADWTK